MAFLSTTLANWFAQRSQRERFLFACLCAIAAFAVALESGAAADRAISARSNAEEVASNGARDAAYSVAAKNGALRIAAWSLNGATVQASSVRAAALVRESLQQWPSLNARVRDLDVEPSRGRLTPIIVAVEGRFEKASFALWLRTLAELDVGFELVGLDVREDGEEPRFSATVQALHLRKEGDD